MMVPIVWSMGVYAQFLDSCIFRHSVLTLPRSQPSVTPQSQPSVTPQSQLSSTLQSQEWVLLDLPIRVTISTGQWVLEQVPSVELSALEAYTSTLSKTEPKSSSLISSGKSNSTEERASNMFARVLVPLGLPTEAILPSKAQSASDAPIRIGLSAGVWRLRPAVAATSGGRGNITTICGRTWRTDIRPVGSRRSIGPRAPCGEICR